jgi:HK97 family phage prohead protease
MAIEERSIKIEVRAAKDGSMAIEGHAAVFNSLSDDLGGFRETILPGAFKRALEESDDILCCFGHDENKLLGRTSSGTCTVTQDEQGLAYRCAMPNTQVGRDTFEQIKRGDITQSSFKFGLDPDDEEADEWDDREGFVRRTIRSVARLFDVSPVLRPAYRASTVKAK